MLAGALVTLLGAAALAAPGRECPGGRIVTLMAYNVENLFDAVYDGESNGRDPTYLPMDVKSSRGLLPACERLSSDYYRKECRTLDWTAAKYRRKLEAVSWVVRSQGRGPDILVLQEVENARVVRDLAAALRAEGYRTSVHFESPDFRGIDVAMLSRFPLNRPAVRYPVFFEQEGRSAVSRDVVVADFNAWGVPLLVAGNHWPSQAHPSHARKAAASVVREIALRAQRVGGAFVALGDFNTLDAEADNPVAGYLTDSVRGTGAPMVDLQLALGWNGYPPGSNYYAGRWSRLDRVLVTKNMLDGRAPIRVEAGGFSIVAPAQILREIRPGVAVPWRFDFETATGYSDHLPVVARVRVLPPHCR